MTTYKTIKEAFANGTGDVFFTKNGEYIAVSHHDDNKYLSGSGFVWLNFTQVKAISDAQNTPIVDIREKLVQHRAKNQAMTKDNIYNGRDGYYDEFPDAYNQSL